MNIAKLAEATVASPNKAATVEKQSGPTTFEGTQLANEVSACAHVSSGTKAKLTLEIIEHEAIHGNCTQTFVKQLRAPGA